MNHFIVNYARVSSKQQSWRLIAASAALIAALAVATPAAAQEAERELGWKNGTELGLVVTTGNSNTTNLNLRNVFTYDWETADLDWEFGILRAASGDDRFALGTMDDFEIIEPETEPDNSRIYNKIRYLRNINPRFFWYGRLDFERDRPADIDYRGTPAGGGGNNWVVREDLTFRTGYGVSYTSQSFTLEGTSNYAGYQLFYDLRSRVTDTTTVESNLTFDGSFESGDNYRFDWFNGVGVSISDRIALKANVRFVYRNVPALEELDLEDGTGSVIGVIVAPKKKLDTAFTTSLVINF